MRDKLSICFYIIIDARQAVYFHGLQNFDLGIFPPGHPSHLLVTVRVRQDWPAQIDFWAKN
jgi:hypothetical protein